MTAYPIDIDAGQLVHWLRDAERRQEEQLSVRASRQYVASPAAAPELERLGEEEAETLSEVTALGLLEIMPPPERGGWVVRVRIEEELAARLPDDENAAEVDEEIDLAAFETDFIFSDSATIDIEAEAEDTAARRRLDRLLAKIRTDRHRKPRTPR